MTDADKARLVHRALRLVESGVRDLPTVAQLAEGVPTPAPEGEPQVVGRGGAFHPLATVAARSLEEDQVLEDLLGTSVQDLWEEWRKLTGRNLEQNHAADAKKAFASQNRALKELEKQDAQMQATGSWPDRSGGLPHAATWSFANALYDKGREAYLAGDSAWDSGDMRVVLVDSADYTVNLAAHQFLSDIAAAGRVAVSGSLTGKTVAAGVADADDAVLANVTGDPSEALVLYDHTGGADTARRLIAYIDTMTGLPITPNGADIVLAFDNGANRIFKL